MGKTGAILLIALLAIAILGVPAEAAGTPTKLITFTDKKVYMGWWFDTPKTGTSLGVGDGDDASDFRIFVYAVILDDDGNIMKGRNGSLSGSANNTEKLSPGQSNAAHHTKTSDTSVFGNFSLIFVDNGSLPGDVAGDGIYVALVNLPEITDATNPLANHYKYNISVRDLVAGTQYTEVLLSGWTCMQAAEGQGHSGATQHVDEAAGVDNCAVCHHGYEHLYENKSKTFNDSQLDVHALKANPPDYLGTDPQAKIFNNYRWNWSDSGSGGATPDNWEAQVPGSKYCAFCHIQKSGSTLLNIYSYGFGDRTNMSDRPSCNSSICHTAGKTKFEQANILPWTQAAANNSPIDRSAFNITLSKSHNHTATNPANVACVLCHDTTHSYTLPNMTRNTTTKPINEQCWLCHNITGGLNITSNGGGNVAHTNTDCKTCHYDASNKLNAHLVPEGVSGGRNCTNCHNVGNTPPSSGALVNFSAMNGTSAIHKNLNNQDITNTSVPAENRKCWACHGNGSDPGDKHPANYKTPYKCVDCHVP
ncbi:MAG: hypothetical protein O8C58_00875, partial [Candidatus Methanoperedens sp.]|nr:hypothetical protein [Candidatus Methanoperedens sp.]